MVLKCPFGTTLNNLTVHYVTIKPARWGQRKTLKRFVATLSDFIFFTSDVFYYKRIGTLSLEQEFCTKLERQYLLYVVQRTIGSTLLFFFFLKCAPLDGNWIHISSSMLQEILKVKRIKMRAFSGYLNCVQLKPVYLYLEIRMTYYEVCITIKPCQRLCTGY